MTRSGARAWLVAGVSGAALFAAGPVLAQTGASGSAASGSNSATSAEALPAPPTPSAAQGTSQPSSGSTSIGEVIVTAQRRSEALQKVPIAVSAFTQATLQAQKIDGGPNLQQAVPNVTFNKSYYAGYNFQIRGIGTKQTAVTGDTSTGIHLNNAPLTENRLFEAEFFDVERVEVLRGPQGTLYGRNATGGVVNVLTAKPNFSDFGGYVRGELGTYDTEKAQGAVNIPLVKDVLALRLAGAYLNRSGFADNVATGNDIDGRNLFSLRGTIGFNPLPTVKTTFMWQHFEENDDRLSTGKALCVRDNGPTSVGGVAVTNAVVRGFLSQGCTNGSIYSAQSFGLPNSLATLYGLSAFRAGLATGDLFAGKTQIADLSKVESPKDPRYRTREDVAEFAASWDITPKLQANVLASFYDGTYDAQRDDIRATPSVPFTSTALAPGGVVNDAQFGPSNLVQVYDSNRHPSQQWTGEARLQSSFDGPLNFSVGGIYIDYNTTQDFYILSNAFQGFANVLNGGKPCALSSACIYISPSTGPDINDHADYLSHQPYHLTSKAVFGELYWKIADNLKFTGGFRFTDDKKVLFSYPVRLFTQGSGVPQGVPGSYTAEFKEPTGRAGLDWTPHLSFTNSTLLYAFYSRGYKGGGPNNIGQGGIGGPRPLYDPEFVNAFEIGTKNTLLDGKLQMNLTGFFYDYQGYQFSKFVNRISVTENINATIKGLEFEGIWQPIRPLRFNMNVGLLDTNIEGGSSIDQINRAQGDPNYTLVKTSAASACLVPTTALANLLNIIQQAPGAPVMAGVSGVPTAILNACAGTYAASLGVVPNDGIPADLTGRQLPNAPHWTFQLGGQYTWNLASGWDAVFRGDLYAQGDSYSRVYNDQIDRIQSWKNINVSFQLNNPRSALQLEFYVKNLLDERPITDSFIVDDALGLLQNAFIQDPRIVGVSVTKKF